MSVLWEEEEEKFTGSTAGKVGHSAKKKIDVRRTIWGGQNKG